MQTNAVPATLLPYSRERQDLPPAATCCLLAVVKLLRIWRWTPNVFEFRLGGDIFRQKKPHSMLRSSLSMKTALKRFCAILLGGISLLLPLASQAQQPAFLSDGLVAYYPFNGNANDESGNGFNQPSGSAVFDSNRMDSVFSSGTPFTPISYTFPINTNYQRSLHFWINIQSFKDHRNIGTVAIPCWTPYGLVFIDTLGRLLVDNGRVEVMYQTSIKANSWYCIDMVMLNNDLRTLSVYVNGQLASSSGTVTAGGGGGGGGIWIAVRSKHYLESFV